MKLSTLNLSSVIYVVALTQTACSARLPERNAVTPFESSGKKVLLEAPLAEAGRELAVVLRAGCVPKAILGERNYDCGAAPSEVERTCRVLLGRDRALKDLEAQARTEPCVIGVGELRRADTEAVSMNLAQTDPIAARQTHRRALGSEAWERWLLSRARGMAAPEKDVLIAIVDTGLDLEHPDLRDHLWINPIEAGGHSGVDDDRNGFVDDIHGYNFPSKMGNPSHETVNDHGTHVAGLAAAVLGNGIGGTGILGRRARILALNVFGRNWGTDTADIDAAIRYAADQGADVINLSIGGPGRSDTTAAAIAYALNRGSIVVSSAGNLSENIDQEFYFPASYAASYPGLIAVGAVQTDTLELCAFSSYGLSSVKIAAPGCDPAANKEGLLSTRAGGGYGHKRGTSMAAPLVTGAVAAQFAALREGLRRPRPADVERRFLSAARTVESLRGRISGSRALSLDAWLDELAR